MLLVHVLFFFGQEACGILAPQLGTEPVSSALGGEVLTTGLREKSTLSRSVHGCSLCLKCLSLYPENSNSVFKTQFKHLSHVFPDPVTPTQAQAILSSAGPPGNLNLSPCMGRGQYLFIWMSLLVPCEQPEDHGPLAGSTCSVLLQVMS